MEESSEDYRPLTETIPRTLKVSQRTVFPWRHKPEIILPTINARIPRDAATKASERIMESVHLTKGPSQQGFSNTAQTAEGRKWHRSMVEAGEARTLIQKEIETRSKVMEAGTSRDLDVQRNKTILPDALQTVFPNSPHELFDIVTIDGIQFRATNVWRRIFRCESMDRIQGAARKHQAKTIAKSRASETNGDAFHTQSQEEKE